MKVGEVFDRTDAIFVRGEWKSNPFEMAGLEYIYFLIQCELYLASSMQQHPLLN